MLSGYACLLYTGLVMKKVVNSALLRLFSAQFMIFITFLTFKLL